MFEHVRVFGPKTETDPSVGKKCPACKKRFRVGDYTALVALGPGASAENRQRAREGRPYNAIAVQVHYACATGFENEEQGEEKRMTLGSLSAEAKAARAPLRPEELVGALQDRVHRDPGRARAAKSVRAGVKRKGEGEKS